MRLQAALQGDLNALLQAELRTAERAVTAALGPVNGTTRKPASRTRATRRAPGSEIAGVPASLIKATESPSARRVTTCCAAASSLCSCVAISRAETPK